MEYTKIEQEFKNELNEICKPTNKVIYERNKTDITYFAYHQLGIRPYTIQHILYKNIVDGKKRIIMCKSRQIGMSFGIGILALWATLYNKFPSGPHKNTKVVIISQSDDQSKKLMAEIKSLIIKGDYWISMLTGGKTQNAMSAMIDDNDRNNMAQISFKNNSKIKCFPPTDKCRGESADILIIDEAAFVEEDIFRNAMEPTVSATDGMIILSSTPKGQNGMFYQFFDPEDGLPEHEYERYWFYWEHCENISQLRIIEEKKRFAEMSGNMKSFDQEYNALFTIDKNAFLDSEKVDKGIDKELSQLYELKDVECAMGIDYGMTLCNTVISITAKYKEGIKLVYQYSFPLGSDDNEITPLVKDLGTRFNLIKYIVDDCPQGYRTNKELENMGLPVEKFNFRSDSAVAERNRGYFLFRAALNQGKIKYPFIPELVIELKNLQEEVLKVTTNISKPKGGYDDRSDSFMMSCYPFLKNEDGDFKSDVVGIPNLPKLQNTFGVDWEWERLRMSGGNLK